MTRKEKLGPERMKAAVEVISNKEMGRYKSSRIFNLPQKTLKRFVKADRKSQVKQ
jgi:hypothetical protein